MIGFFNTNGVCNSCLSSCLACKNGTSCVICPQKTFVNPSGNNPPCLNCSSNCLRCFYIGLLNQISC